MHPAGCATYLTHLATSSPMHERDLLTHVQERIEFAEGLQHVEAYMGCMPLANTCTCNMHMQHAHAHAHVSKQQR